MAITFGFPTTGPLPDLDGLAVWLDGEGEAHDVEGTDTLALKALPLRIVHAGASVRAHLELGPDTRVSRALRLVYALSGRLGADVRLSGVGTIDRASLWLRLADEQDRLRLAAAIARAETHPQRDEIARLLWAVVGAASPGRPVRWDTSADRVVEVREVGTPDGISRDEAAFHAQGGEAGDEVNVPVAPPIHILAWRWLSEAWPALADHRRGS